MRGEAARRKIKSESQKKEEEKGFIKKTYNVLPLRDWK